MPFLKSALFRNGTMVVQIECHRVLQGGHAACILCRTCREADRQHALGWATISTEASVPGLGALV